MYIANVDEEGFENNELLDQVTAYATSEGAGVVAVCAAIEAEIAQLEEDEKAEFLTELGLEEPGLNRVIRAGYDLLGLQTFFTAGEKEVRAWTVKQGATAPNGAGRIHTDFEKGFIRAEVVSYDHFIEFNGEQGAKDAGKWRLEGKEYLMLEGDVSIHNAGVGGSSPPMTTNLLFLLVALSAQDVPQNTPLIIITQRCFIGARLKLIMVPLLSVACNLGSG